MTADSGCVRERSPNWIIGDSHMGAILDEVSVAFHRDCKIIGGLGFNVLLSSSLTGNSLPSGQPARMVELRSIEDLLSSIQLEKTQVVMVTHYLTGLMGDPSTSTNSANSITVEWRDEDNSTVSRSEFIHMFYRNLESLADALARHNGVLIITSPPPDFDWLAEPNDSYSDLNYETLCSDTYVATTHPRVVPQCEIWRTESTISYEVHKKRIGEIQQRLNDLEQKKNNVVHFALDQFFCTDYFCSNYIQGEPAYVDDDHLNARGALLVGESLRELVEIVHDKLQANSQGG
jgi:hypothetical protein